MDSHTNNDARRSPKAKATVSYHDLNFSDDEDTAGDTPVPDDDRRSRRPISGGKRGAGAGAGAGGAAPPSCQVELCAAVLADAKRYHRRHKVCEFHAKAPVVIVAGLRQRFCQQCSRFHELSEFDEAKRSCRRRLAGHNERRRKSSTSEPQGDGSGGRKVGPPTGGDPTKESQCWAETDERGRVQMTHHQATGNAAAAYKHFQIR